MMVELPLLTAADTSVLLYAKLGQAKAWAYFLADNIRERQDLVGFRLLPYAADGPVDGKCRRPLYRRSDIDAFIANVLTMGGVVRAPVALRPIMVMCDDTPGMPWVARRAKRITPAKRRATATVPTMPA